ncbi:S8 family peptidase [Lysobacter capsici]|uniref:S8 family peptidase n=1 Tax=Lysobacter capsici TaxID=435897 RepID=UPI001C0076DA|nr:S8 family serine peptidase [Lysobacter capsici]QWF15833.1 S8 family serine peptidase [Lysobacter capsici]
MSDRTMRGLRKHALAAATVTALSCVAVSAYAADRINLTALANAGQQDEFIVKYRDGSAARSNEATLLKSLSAASTGFSGKSNALGLKHVRRTSIGADVVRAGRKLDRAEAESLMRQIAADPNVEFVEPNARMTAFLTPNDTRFGEQWGYTASGINATQAWDVSTGTGVVVAVIDTGITSHSDLNANIIGGYDFISDATAARDSNGRDSNPADQGDWFAAADCGLGYASNSSWHGTHVAGTIAAVTNNAKGVSGTAYNAKVVPVRVLGRCGGTLADIADAITWASGGTVSGVPANPNPAEVINMSLGGSGACGSTYQTAIDGAVSRGVTVVVAAGNNNGNASNARPANCTGVITVGAVDSNGARSVWSSTQKSNYGAVVDVAAPGSNILSTLNAGTTTPGAESYASYGGTSMATPHVAGVVALIQAKATTPKTPAEIETILKNTARAFPSTPDQPIGVGIVNAKAALDSLGGGNPNPGTQTYSNGTDYNIPDNNATGVSSTITVSGRTGNAPSNASVTINIIHPYKGDLKVDLIAPDGSVYNLHNNTGGSADNVAGTYTVNLSSETLNGAWKLRAVDSGPADVGRIDTWSITF